MNWDGEDFAGTKIALLCGDRIVTYLRDDIPTIPYPGQWDLPGGGRENGEGPITCALRETEEEFALVIHPDRVTHLTRYAGLKNPSHDSYFCMAEITSEEISSIRFGDEGQFWELMTVDAFLSHPDAIPHLQDRLRAALESRSRL